MFQPHSCAALLVISCVSATFTFHGSHQTVEPATRLDDDRVIERTLSGAAEHRYELTLRPGTRTTVSVLQRGIDVRVSAIAPDGTVLALLNEEPRANSDERVDIVAHVDGTYVVGVRAMYPRAAAGQYVIRRSETRSATDDDRVRQEVQALRAAYQTVLDRDGQRAARPLVERALAVSEATLPSDDLDTTFIRRDLGAVLVVLRDYKGAAPLFERAATVFEKAFGADHPHTASVWTSLAATYGGLAQRAKAETLAQRALDVSEKTLGPDHPFVAFCLITLGGLRANTGDFDVAEELERRALAIVEKTTGDGRQKEIILNNLGMASIGRQKYDQADDFLRRSLELQERFGSDAAQIAITLQNLGIVARQKREFAQAENYYLRALALRQKTLGPDHPDVAMNLNNLANVYRAKGDTARSLATHLQVLDILEKSTPPYSGVTVTSLGNIARTYAALGDMPRAIEFQRRVETAIETQLALNLAIGSERQKLAFVNSMSERTERTLSLDADSRFAEPDATGLAALVLLQRKGRVLDAMTDTLASVRGRLESPADQRLLDTLAATTTDLARLVLSDAQNVVATDRVAAIKKLEREKERLESDLSARSVEFRAHATPLTLSAVQSVIPDDTALIEFAVYRPFDPKAESNNTAYGAPRYIAYVLTRRTASGVDLGPDRAIDDAVEALRQALGNPQRTDVHQHARQLDGLVMQPVRRLLAGTTRLLISPDGALNLIPFEALRDERDRYAIEQYAISYLTSGRDLLRMEARRPSRTGAVVVADPQFGEPSPGSTSKPATSPEAARRSITSVEDLSTAYFARLGGTALEAQRIKSLFPDATVLTRERATKTAIRQLQAPQMLHIATHGFFIRDTQHKIANPLLRSGLALSGANLRATAGDGSDGILTALEASSLNLWGTKLVTLSACDTGLGEIKNGEGLYGLRRAFLLAGAETLVMSLWPVNDSATRELMTDYYSGLRQGLGRGEALQKSKLAMLTRKSRQHPFYWASFIQAGEWASLDGRR